MSIFEEQVNKEGKRDSKQKRLSQPPNTPQIQQQAPKAKEKLRDAPDLSQKTDDLLKLDLEKILMDKVTLSSVIST